MTTSTEARPEIKFLSDLYDRLHQYATERRKMTPVVQFEPQRVNIWTTAEGRHMSTVDLGIDLERAEILANRGLILGITLGRGSLTRFDFGNVTRLQFGGWNQSLQTFYRGKQPDLTDLRYMVHWHFFRHGIGFHGEFYFDEGRPGLGLQVDLPEQTRRLIRQVQVREILLTDKGLKIYQQAVVKTISTVR